MNLIEKITFENIYEQYSIKWPPIEILEILKSGNLDKEKISEFYNNLIILGDEYKLKGLDSEEITDFVKLNIQFLEFKKLSLKITSQKCQDLKKNYENG